MKQINIFAFFFALTLLFGGCEDTNEILVASRGEAVNPIITGLKPAVFDSNDPEHTYVQFNLGVEEGSVLENAIVKVSRITSKSKIWDKKRVDYTTISSFPSNIQVSAKDAMAKMNYPMDSFKLGSAIRVEVWTTTNGKVYQTKAAFDAGVVCAYNPANAVGSYHAVSAGWGSEGNVTITADSTNPNIVYVSGLETIEGANEDKGPLKMTINPDTYAVTVTKTVLASDFFGYHNITYAGSGKFDTCSNSYEMSFSISVDEGNFGSYAFTLTKN